MQQQNLELAGLISSMNFEEIRNKGESVIPQLVTLLSSNNKTIYKESVIKALVAFGEQAIAPLLIGLDDQDEFTRSNSAKALGQIGNNRAIGGLIMKLRDEANIVAYRSAEALGKIGDPRSIQALICSFDDSCPNQFPSINKAAIYALVEIGEPSVESLINGLGDEYDFVRRSSAIALGRIGSKKAILPLIACLQVSGGDVGRFIIQSLELLGDKSAVPFIIDEFGIKTKEVSSCQGLKI